MYGGNNLRIPASRSLLRSRFVSPRNTMRVAVWISRHYGHNDYRVMYVSWSVSINGGYFSWLQAESALQNTSRRRCRKKTEFVMRSPSWICAARSGPGRELTKWAIFALARSHPGARASKIHDGARLANGTGPPVTACKQAKLTFPSCCDSCCSFSSPEAAPLLVSTKNLHSGQPTGIRVNTRVI